MRKLLKKFENLIKQDGGVAKAYKANVLDQESLEQVRNLVNAELGTVDILINGAGGNNPKSNYR